MEEVMALLSLGDRREAQGWLHLRSRAHSQSGAGVGRVAHKANFSGLWDLEQTLTHFCLLVPPDSTLMGFGKSRV